MGKSLAEVHALERARWDALVPATFDPSSQRNERRTEALLGQLLAGVSDFLGELHGRRAVEYGCGLGDLTLRLAREGVHVTAVDLSPRSIEYVRRRAREAGLAANVEAHVAAAERLPFFDESFDLALGHAVLRCVMPELGAPELQRVLRPQGRAVFFEPLRRHGMPSFLPDLAREPRERRGAPRRWMPGHEIACWSAGFSNAEVRFFELRAELRPRHHDAGWRRLLERLPRRRRVRRHAALLLRR